MTLNVLIADDDPIVVQSISHYLKDDYKICKSSSVEETLKILKSGDIQLVLLDVNFGDGKTDGLAGLKAIKKINETVNVVMLTASRSTDVLLQAMSGGAADYLLKPASKDELLFLLKKIEIKRKLERENKVLKTRLQNLDEGFEIIFRSEAMKALLERTDRLRGRDVNVLIIGESGTGKELIARRLNGCRADTVRPFIPVNCAAIPSNLLESTLFGYEKSSYTGATKSNAGKFELADGGDIFLDEISTLDFELQAKLLRVIQEKQVERIGALYPKKISFRVISATNQSVANLIKQGKFREDLYYRINAVELIVPPLRERKEDIPLLIEHFTASACTNCGNKKFAPETIDRLMKYDWPGNVRQLKHMVMNMVIMSDDDVITPDHVTLPHTNAGVSEAKFKLEHGFENIIDQIEQQLIEHAIQKTSSMREAADLLKLKPTTFYSKLEKHKRVSEIDT